MLKLSRVGGRDSHGLPPFNSLSGFSTGLICQWFDRYFIFSSIDVYIFSSSAFLEPEFRLSEYFESVLHNSFCAACHGVLLLPKIISNASL